MNNIFSWSGNKELVPFSQIALASPEGSQYDSPNWTQESKTEHYHEGAGYIIRKACKSLKMIDSQSGSFMKLLASKEVVVDNRMIIGLSQEIFNVDSKVLETANLLRVFQKELNARHVNLANNSASLCDRVDSLQNVLTQDSAFTKNRVALLEASLSQLQDKLLALQAKANVQKAQGLTNRVQQIQNWKNTKGEKMESSIMKLQQSVRSTQLKLGVKLDQGHLKEFDDKYKDLKMKYVELTNKSQNQIDSGELLKELEQRIWNSQRMDKQLKQKLWKGNSPIDVRQTQMVPQNQKPKVKGGFHSFILDPFGKEEDSIVRIQLSENSRKLMPNQFLLGQKICRITALDGFGHFSFAEDTLLVGKKADLVIAVKLPTRSNSIVSDWCFLNTWCGNATADILFLKLVPGGSFSLVRTTMNQKVQGGLFHLDSRKEFFTEKGNRIQTPYLHQVYRPKQNASFKELFAYTKDIPQEAFYVQKMMNFGNAMSFWDAVQSQQIKKEIAEQNHDTVVDFLNLWQNIDCPALNWSGNLIKKQLPNTGKQQILKGKIMELVGRNIPLPVYEVNGERIPILPGIKLKLHVEGTRKFAQKATHVLHISDDSPLLEGLPSILESKYGIGNRFFCRLTVPFRKLIAARIMRQQLLMKGLLYKTEGSLDWVNVPDTQNFVAYLHSLDLYIPDFLKEIKEKPVKHVKCAPSLLQVFYREAVEEKHIQIGLKNKIWTNLQWEKPWTERRLNVLPKLETLICEHKQGVNNIQHFQQHHKSLFDLVQKVLTGENLTAEDLGPLTSSLGLLKGKETIPMGGLKGKGTEISSEQRQSKRKDTNSPREAPRSNSRRQQKLKETRREDPRKKNKQVHHPRPPRYQRQRGRAMIRR